MEHKESMISEKLSAKLQESLSFTLNSAHYYRCMYLWLKYQGYHGIASHCYNKYNSKMYEFTKVEEHLLDRCFKPYIPDVEEMKHDYSSVKEIFELSKNIEVSAENGWKKLYLECFQDNDFTTLEVVKYFLERQKEYIAKYNYLLDKIKLADGNKEILFKIDEELSCKVCIE